ncbi:MAG TPA: tRNA preQ1(34) S-adenosylmethionine ribosyltransferase-isomerase QueA [Dehalococcoidia bacterium]|jgi:S-adenosylmethionine:tRNA ribosyltransferase-isomerase|nr:tRNA preQ1(34) S-adenosylmethionine ribosyltransferase-isomerase QueA [Dehalococcoidia bacterium]
MKTSDFDYYLPPELIAQTPVEPRDHSRLMVLRRRDGVVEHRHFFELVDYLHKGDVLVFNDSRVIPARLKGRKVDTGGKVEILLLRRLEANVWEALVKPGKRLRAGSSVEILNEARDNLPRVRAEVIGHGESGTKVLRFSDETVLPELGEVPLPPYIHTTLAHPERYQTVYARIAGSVAAPTAGLHFTPELLRKLEEKGVHLLFVSLHIGLDTFSPVREDDPREHRIHREYGVLSEEVAQQLSQAKKEGRRVICVGTTAVRILEHVAQLSEPPKLQPFEGWVSLFILPGYQFRLTDGLITNFHLPRSTLLMLVSAFAGKEFIERAYQEAIASGYRFYSFGDAMLIF